MSKYKITEKQKKKNKFNKRKEYQPGFNLFTRYLSLRLFDQLSGVMTLRVTHLSVIDFCSSDVNIRPVLYTEINDLKIYSVLGNKQIKQDCQVIV